MKYRLDLLKQHKLGLPDIQKVISEMGPEPGARFLDAAPGFQVIILSDTFYEFARPLMQQLGMPTLFCHKLRSRRRRLCWSTTCAWPTRRRKPSSASRKSTSRSSPPAIPTTTPRCSRKPTPASCSARPDNVIAEFPQFPVEREYSGLMAQIRAASARI